jgi:hypothetical protein
MLAGPDPRSDGLFVLIIASQHNKICRFEGPGTMLAGWKADQLMTVLTAAGVSEADAPCKRCGKPNSSDDLPHIGESQQATVGTKQTNPPTGDERLAVLDPACERIALESAGLARMPDGQSRPSGQPMLLILSGATSITDVKMKDYIPYVPSNLEECLRDIVAICSGLRSSMRPISSSLDGMAFLHIARGSSRHTLGNGRDAQLRREGVIGSRSPASPTCCPVRRVYPRGTCLLLLLGIRSKTTPIAAIRRE